MGVASVLRSAVGRSARAARQRATTATAGLAVISLTLLAVGSVPAALFGVGLLIVVVARTAAADAPEGRRTALRLIVGLAPAIVLVGAVHDLLAIRPPAAVSGAALAIAWAVTSRTLGAAAARAVPGRSELRDVTLRMTAIGGVTAFVAGAMVRLVAPGVSSVERLAWTLGEEDNAHVMGVARELLADGPRGAGLADQFGTSFMSLPLMLAEILGGLPEAAIDPRLGAISAFTVSTLIVILLAGLSMASLAALPHHVHRSAPTPPPSASVSVIGAVGVALAATLGMSLLIVLPMRTGFLTFVWGITLVLVGSATAASVPPDADRRIRTVLLAVLTALTVLLLSSWPFILPALGGILLVPFTWIRWGRLSISTRRHPRRWATGVVAAVLAMSVVATMFSQWGPAAEVLSYGREILLVSASGIAADDLLRRGAFVATVVALGLLLSSRGRSASAGLIVAVIGPVVGALALYGALRVAAAILTDGELNYSGIKLLYGTVVLAAVLGLLSLLSQLGRAGTVSNIGAASVVGLLLVLSPTARLITDWWPRTEPNAPPHAVAAIDMIEQTTPNLPIRCLPAPGTRITDGSRLAAYWCARWMEDAFNEGRFQGHRDELLLAEGETFGPIVEDILANSPSEYLFSARMTLGPGWFAWDGRS